MTHPIHQGPKRLADALVRAGVLTAADVPRITRIRIDAADGAPVRLHITRIGDVRLEAALAELDPTDVHLEQE